MVDIYSYNVDFNQETCVKSLKSQCYGTEALKMCYIFQKLTNFNILTSRLISKGKFVITSKHAFSFTFREKLQTLFSLIKASHHCVYVIAKMPSKEKLL